MKSMVTAVFALGLGLFAAMGGWHAWMESGSIAWTAGYAALFVLSLAVAIRNLVRTT